MTSSTKPSPRSAPVAEAIPEQASKKKAAKAARAAQMPEETSRRVRNKASPKRNAILAAAIEEFAASGFAATRLDDVARRANVAKGTIYLYFADKEALFQELVRTILLPVVARMAVPPRDGVSVRAVITSFADLFIDEIVMTRRGDILRLIISEGPRFPSLAEFYHREVISRAIAAMTRLIELGIARNEIDHVTLSRYPHLVVAPVIMGVIWQGLFGKLAPLDVKAMMHAHLDILFGPEPQS